MAEDVEAGNFGNDSTAPFGTIVPQLQRAARALLGSTKRNSDEPEAAMVPQQTIDLRRDDINLTIAMKAARYRACRIVRRSGRPSADIDDLSQSLLIALLLKCRHFDPACSSWSTFAAMVARHAAADLAEKRQCDPALLPLEEDDHPQIDQRSTEALTLDLSNAITRLPHSLRRLVELVAETGSLAEAQKLSALSTASFYRRVHDLRMRLTAAGLAPTS